MSKRSGGAFDRRSVDQVAQELAGHHAGGLGLQPGEDELGRPVDTDEQVALAFLGPGISNVDMDGEAGCAIGPSSQPSRPRRS